MDPLEVFYESADEIPENFRELYSEKDGKHVLTGVNGLKTQQDVNNVQEALRKERENHAVAKEAVKSYKKLGDDPDAILAKLDRIKELEIAAGGSLDEDKMAQLVEARLAQKTGPLQRQLEELTTGTAEKDQLINSLQSTIVSRDRNDVVRAVATEMKVLPTAVADVEMVAAQYLERDETSGNFIVKADARGVTPGVDAKQFLKEMQKSRPHWWPASEGGGAGGGKGGFSTLDDNPWSANGWSLTQQGQYVKEYGMAKAQEAAKAAGTRIGGTRPQKK